MPPGDVSTTPHPVTMLEASHVRVGAASPPDAPPTPAPVVDASAQRDASAQPPKQLPPSDGGQLPRLDDAELLLPDSRVQPMR